MVPQYAKVIGAILIPNISGAISARWKVAADKDGWYKKLKLPSLNPPGWVFPPVWTSLFSAMGYASYLVWRDGNGFAGRAKLPLILYGVQLALNFAYVPIFFGHRNIKGGLIDIVALTGAASTCGILFFKINPMAGYMFIPYIGWLSFASYLNFRIWKLNPNKAANMK